MRPRRPLWRAAARGRRRPAPWRRGPLGYGQRVAQPVLGERVFGRVLPVSEGRLGRAAQQARVGHAMVVLLDEGGEASVDLGERADVLAEEIEAALAQRPPEALDLS